MLLLSKSSGVAIDRDQAIKPNLSPVFELQNLLGSQHTHPQSDPELGRFLQLQCDRKSDKFAAALLGF